MLKKEYRDRLTKKHMKCDLALEKWDKTKTAPAREKKPNTERDQGQRRTQNPKQVHLLEQDQSQRPNQIWRQNNEQSQSQKRTLRPALEKNQEQTRKQPDTPSYDPQVTTSLAQTRKEVWIRDEGKCQNCSSTYALELDHKIPKALGGKDSLENLRILCRPCNQWAAIQTLGLSKMEKYLGKLKPESHY